MTAQAESPATAGDAKLKRHIGRFGLLFSAVGSVIGSGWLFGAMKASQTAGPAAILSWILGMVMILLIGLVFAELGPMFPVSGGVVRFPHIAHGWFASYTMGWVTWIACATVAPIEVEGALQYATKYLPFTAKKTVNGETVHTLTALGYGTAVVLMAVFVVINYFGIRWFARINNVLVGWKLVIISVVVIAFLITQFHGSNFSSKGFAPLGAGGIFSAVATSGITFSFLGFRQGIELAGETDNPRRNIPFAVIGSVVVCGLIYILLQVAFIGALDPKDFANGWQNVSFTNDFGPLAAIASILGLGWLAVLLYIDAVISPGDTGLIYTTVTARISYAMSKNKNAPEGLSKVSRSGAPWVSLLLSFIVGLIVFLPFPSWQQLVSFITSATVLSFASGPVAMAALRRQIPEHERPFKLPGGDVIPFLAFYSANMIVFWAGWNTNYKLFLALLLGFVVLAIYIGVTKARGGTLPPYDLRSGATWALPWLAGLALISYLGEYDGGKNVLKLGVGAIVMLVWSAIIYALALRVRLSREDVDKHIETTMGEAAEEEQELGATPA